MTGRDASDPAPGRGRPRRRRLAVGASLPGAVLGAWLACLGLANADPATGQTLPEFEAAVVASLARQGDRMGYMLRPCALDPPFAPAGETYLGRTFTEREDVQIVLVAVEAGRVSRWTEFDLPDLEGWLTHGNTWCRGSTLDVVHGRMIQRYRWTGKNFIRRPPPGAAR